MGLVALAAALVALVALNAFFVFTEFAIVRVRPSRVTELVAQGVRGAHILRIVQRDLDEHLGVCQVGITLASVALGIVGQRAAEIVAGPGEHAWGRYLVAITVSYFVVTGTHVVLGEMVPKTIAIRMADRVALLCVVPLRAFRTLFYPLLWLFSALALTVSRLVGLPRTTDEERHTEEELRIILDHFQERGHISFRRLLFMENVFDFGLLRVKNVMRTRPEVAVLRANDPWHLNLEVIRAGRFTRYPLVGDDSETPIGFVHLKDLVVLGADSEPDLERLARPLLATSEEASLESLLGEMQRKRVHAAVVIGGPDGRWTGFVTLEDVIEEIVGTIRDEFEEDVPARFADALTVSRIQLDIEADSPVAAVRTALSRIPREELPFPGEWISLAVEERERTAGTYMGDGIAIPHARLLGLTRPFAMILRSTKGIPCAGTTEKAHLLFVILTPAGEPRVHQSLLQTVAMLLHESHYVSERLRTATAAAEVLEVVRAGEQASLDARASEPPQRVLPRARAEARDAMSG
ncbi:MAG TPA: CNNM domain-containing protein [Polyangiaceae bacterium]|nr:CNNM domain-containing protein [Polyangiaceae bacterium]